MANHPSAEKRNRERIQRTLRNRSVKGAVRTMLKKARALVAAPATKPADTAAAIVAAVRSVDRAASKGVIHHKTAARAKSRLAKAAHKASKSA
jgi:small subunit ribosomal protein S20